MIERTPRFVWPDNDETLTLPVGMWDYTFPTVGGEVESDSGFPASYMVKLYRCLAVPLRFYEEEWPTIRALIEHGQLGESFTWYVGADDEEGVEVYLEAPALGDDVTPNPDPDFPAVLFFTLVLRRADGEPWDDLPYFEIAEPDSVGGLRWTPTFIFGPDDELETWAARLPVGLWAHNVPTVGTSRKTATGIPGASLDHRKQLITVPVRFFEDELPIMRRLLEWGWTKAPFIWVPESDPYAQDQIVEASVILHAPTVTDVVSPQRDGQYPRALVLPLTFRQLVLGGES